MNILMTVITAILSSFFAFAGSIKVTGWQKQIYKIQLEFFHSYRLNRQIMFTVGLIECLGAIGVWFQSNIIGILAAAVLFMTSLGAITFHLIFDTFKNAIPACITMILSGILAWHLQDHLIKFVQQLIQ